jgi:DNA polymerase-1
MERSGARLNVQRLHEFQAALDNELSELGMSVWRNTGVRLEPNKNKTWDKLFIACGLDPHTDGGKSSNTEDFLKTIKHSPIVDGLRMRRLCSLKSKYLSKYEAARIKDLLTFQLYQLRSGEDEKGTVVGRYSSANVNIQQVFKVENQVKRFGDGYIIRELMIPDDGFDMFAMDGSQLQFRLFAHLSQDKDLIRAYHEGYERWLRGGKDVDFHQMVADLFGMSRQNAKTNNFALVMGMGRARLANNLGKGCNCQPEDYWWWKGDRDTFKRFEVNNNHAGDCPAREANDLADQYDGNFPSAVKTMEYVVDFAKKQGFVPTLLGRRRRYAEFESRGGVRQKTRYYKALASWLQGSEADVVKTKILTVYNHRKDIGIHKMRMPVHDEMTGDIDKDPAARKRLQEISRIQEIPCRVPIVWNDDYGQNWRECSGK